MSSSSCTVPFETIEVMTPCSAANCGPEMLAFQPMPPKTTRAWDFSASVRGCSDCFLRPGRMEIGCRSR
eukprot:9013061-Alexandrium_andersonii.AAC.1